MSGWYPTLVGALLAARAPLLTGLIYLGIVAVPDQSAEAARMILDESVSSAWLNGAVWLATSGYFALALATFGIRALRLHRATGVHEIPFLHWAIVALLIAIPYAAGLLALEPRTAWERGVPVGMDRTAYQVAMFSFALLAAMPWAILVFAMRDRRQHACDAYLRALLSGTMLKALPPTRATITAPGDHRRHVIERLHGLLTSELNLDAAIGVAVLFTAWLVFWGTVGHALEFTYEVPTVIFLPLWGTTFLIALLTVLRLGRWLRVPILVPATLWVLLLSCTDVNDNHEVRHRVVEQSRRPVAEPVDRAFRGWLDTRRNRIEEFRAAGQTFPVILVAAEGGGARAAYFTALVLEELRALCPAFLNHTFLMAGVSGGSLGTALVAASAAQAATARTSECAEPGVDTPAEARRREATEATRTLSADLLAPAVRGALVPDLLARFVPWDVGPLLPPGSVHRLWRDDVRAYLLDVGDRARYLERGLERAWSAETGRSLRDLYFRAFWPGVGSDTPGLVLLTTEVETGRRLAISHFAFRAEVAPQEDRCAPRPGIKATADERAGLRSLAEIAPGIDLPLATAAILSARFTYLSPAGTLPCPGERRRLVDGGYFENSAVTSILDIAEMLRPVAVEERNLQVIILRIENGRATTNAATRYGAEPEPPDGGFSELAAPFRALLGTRNARGDQARAALSRAVLQAESDCAAAGALPAPGVSSNSQDMRPPRPREPLRLPKLGQPQNIDGQRASPAELRNGRNLPCMAMQHLVFALEPRCVPIPLGWALTEAARAEMLSQLRHPAQPGCGDTDTEPLNRRERDRLLRLIAPAPQTPPL